MVFRHRPRGAKAEINVTPLVDVVLVLLIIFMVLTPMLQRGQAVVLPKAAEADDERRGDPIVISVTADRVIWIESAAVGEADLEAALGQMLRGRPGTKVLLKGDERLTVGDVRSVMQKVRIAGASGVALAVEQKK